MVDRRKLTRPGNSAGAGPCPWYRIQNKADDSSVAQVDIYDEIDWYWGISAANFRRDLNALGDEVKTIDLHINSPGGDVYEAIAIMNSLRQHSAKVVTTVDGYAASSAGFIAVGASDELIVAENAEIMAHLPWAVMIGDAGDMRKMADDLDRIGKNIASIFAARAGGDITEWMDVLTAETWWSAQEAVDAGIADKVLAAPKRDDAKDSAKNRFDLSLFNHAGRSNAPAPRILVRNRAPQPVEAEVNNGKEPPVASLSESALKKLGLDAEADDAAVEAAIDAALAENDTDDAGGATTPPAEPTIEQAAAVAAKFGQKLVASDQYDQLVATVSDLSSRRDQQVQSENEAAVMSALRSGRIGPKDADTWRAEIARNREGTLKLLNTLPANTALAVQPVGHGVDSEDATTDAELAGAFAKITGQPYGKDA